MKIRILAVWFVMLLVSILNGTMRDFTYGKHLPDLLAQQISTVSGIVLLGLVIFLYTRKWPFTSARQAWQTGLFWMSLTVAFEFLFFHYVGGHSWQILLANYDISAGRLWPLILLWVACAPYLFFRLSQPRGVTSRT
ncbi:MAG: hypothetical protein KJ850_10290 [Gammaproteobacteria bacterium]|nr:hypothetical protein [Gammaproteobacteria bacterium]MBU1625419.1 hypothetical protein [Gammaproteobacteria bacterium]MBU1981679.1 hypothetical protein [Gammaproteobacteria bacterium]